ncbi:matrix metalloproteinase-18-like [Asterias amurensis]|uniref:matrix metalloproteinase-18-like n=1 Tax=Asterias amurensis TaxID=7602 RepID=UPI003AB42919
MKFDIALTVLCLVVLTSTEARPSSRRVNRQKTSPVVVSETVNYLKKYGYLNEDGGSIIIHEEDPRFIAALRRMQGFFNIPPTGQLDPKTLKLTRKPRCGCPDVIDTTSQGLDDALVPQQLSVAGLSTRFRWFHTDVNYTFLNYPSGKGALKPSTVRQIMRKAFKKWSDVTPLTFSEVLSSSDDGADIKIQFARRRHNQEEPPVRYFDGPGGDVAHAFLPNSNWGDLDGDIHFDDEDMFTKDGTEGFALLLVAIHEIGHSLGLSHSYMENSVMWPYYKNAPTKGYTLPEFDVQNIQSIYGEVAMSKPVGRAEPKDGRNKKQLPDAATAAMCQEPYTALLKMDMELFAFRDNMVWRIRIKDRQLLSPAKGESAKRYWNAMPSKITAAYQRHDGNVVFFKGDKYYVYKGKNREGRPGQISSMGVKRPMAALRASHLAPNKAYLLRGTEVWLYDEAAGTVDHGYPKPACEVWGDLPAGITGGDMLDSETTIFLKGTRYFEMDNNNRVTSPRGNQSNLFSVHFLGCK